jgi:hypothetical protein
LAYIGGTNFKYYTLPETNYLQTSEVINFRSCEINNLRTFEVPRQRNRIIILNHIGYPKKKPPELSGEPIATAATGRWNILMIPSIKSFCQAFFYC